jgi:hypothetical protein
MKIRAKEYKIAQSDYLDEKEINEIWNRDIEIDKDRFHRLLHVYLAKIRSASEGELLQLLQCFSK